jgi:two-component system sensor histidine kinase RpfC
VNKIIDNQQRRDGNAEFEQAFLRLVLAASGLVYAAILIEYGLLEYEYSSPIFIIAYLYVGFSVSASIYVYLRPEGNRSGHAMQMSLDVLVIALVMHGLEKYGIPLFAEYLWLIVGNGFRYGYREAIRCSFMSMLSFVVVVATTPFWREEILLTTTAMILLTVIPLYVAIMLKRIQLENEKAEAANIEKSRFLANISHELRTPLNAIVGFSGLMDKVADDIQKARLLRRIQDASASLLALVEDVLDYSRIEAGHVELIDEEVNVFACADTIRGMFEPLTQKKDISLVLDVSPAMCPVVRSDKHRLKQILVNLVGNAVKFTSHGRIIIRIGRAERDSVSVLQVDVIDTGVGIPAEIQPYIFDRFRQADNSVSRRHGGAGLGTAIAKHLVELMGGEIGLESEPGNGSRFWFRIPLRPSEPSQEEFRVFGRGARVFIVSNDTGYQTRIEGALRASMHSGVVLESLTGDEAISLIGGDSCGCCFIVDCVSLPQSAVDRVGSLGGRENVFCIAHAGAGTKRPHLLETGYRQVVQVDLELETALSHAASILGGEVRPAEGRSSGPLARDGHARRILVVEDSEMNRQVIKGILEYVGLDVKFAGSGIEALKRLKEEVFDLIIVDIQMPGMSGLEVISRCKALFSGNTRIPIVVITGDVTKDVQDECNALGVDRFLAKPVESERLRGVVYELLAG